MQKLKIKILYNSHPCLGNLIVFLHVHFPNRCYCGSVLQQIRSDVKSGKDKKVRHQVHPSVSPFFRDDIKKKDLV